MNKALIIAILFCCFLPVNGQTLSRNDALKFDADYYMMEKDFEKAKDIYLTILKTEPENADVKYRLGICYLNSDGEKDKALVYLEEAAQKVSEKYNPSSFKEENAPPDAYFLLGSAYRISNETDKAIAAYTRYRETLDPKDEYNLAVTDQYIRSCHLAKEMQANPRNYTLLNLGAPVNTDQPNFNAVVSGDGRTLFYTSPGRQGYEIFTAEQTNGTWSAPRNITQALGTGRYMKTCDLSYDGQTLLLVLDDPMNADIFVSRFSKNRWSKAESIGKEINSKMNETHGSLSADGKTLYFTSNRKGGLGDLDIYKAERDEKGGWGKPVNLGAAINTPFNEETPFVTDDGTVLFFSSEGHTSMGGYDIFRYQFENPGQGAVNMGYPLNTTDNDLFYVPFGDGTLGYYAYNGDDSYGGRDIYQVMVPPEVEEPVEMAVEAPAVVEAEPVPVEPLIAEEVAAETPVADTLMAVEEPVAETPPVEVVPEPVVEETVAAEAEPELFVEEAVAAEVEPEPFVEEATPAEAEPVTEVIAGTFTAAFYRVQIMALRKPVDMAHFKGVSGVILNKGADNWYRYLVGATTDLAEAGQLLQQIKAQGYPDAFIRRYPFVPRFTIQVMAVPGPVADLLPFASLKELAIVRGADGFCRYSTGEFATREAALAELERVKALGYKQAFTTVIRNP